MAGAPRSKQKGTDPHAGRAGLGRLRRAHAQEGNRIGGWAERAEDDTFLERHATAQGARSHGGERLLMAFNRLARATDDAPGTPGEVSGFAGNRVLVRTQDGNEHLCSVRSALLKQLAGVRNPLSTGDLVKLDLASDAVITALAPRRTQLARADSHNRALIHVLAANVDVLVVVASLADPELKPGIIDRWLLLAAWNDLTPILVLNKSDLADPGRASAIYQRVGITTVSVCSTRVEGMDALRPHLAGRTCVIVGQSGVGKSSLLNALHPTLGARIGRVADQGHGRHTTTSSRMYPLAAGCRLIDTPGVRECAVTGMTPLDVALLMPDLARFHPQCRFADCSHRHEPDCAVLAALDRGDLAPTRYASYLGILAEDLKDVG